MKPTKFVVFFCIFVIVSIICASCSGNNPEKQEPVAEKKGEQAQVAEKKTEENFRKPGEDLLVKGKLVFKDGSAIDGAGLTFFFDTPKGGVLKVGDGGVLLNPSGETDSNGEFVVKITDKQFEISDKYSIRVSYSNWTADLKDQMGATIAFKFDKKLKEFDIGTVTIDK